MSNMYLGVVYISLVALELITDYTFYIETDLMSLEVSSLSSSLVDDTLWILTCFKARRYSARFLAVCRHPLSFSICINNLVLHHDMASAHTALEIQEFTPNSLILFLFDIYLFPELECTLN